MIERSKPGVAFWATVVVVAVLVAYPLGFGPACWLVENGELAARPVARLYRPILWGMQRSALMCVACYSVVRLPVESPEWTVIRLMNASGLNGGPVSSWYASPHMSTEREPL
jgi:hypothetical protein